MGAGARADVEDMRLRWAVLLAVVVGALLAAWFIWPTLYVYRPVGQGAGMMRINRVSQEVAWLVEGQWKTYEQRRESEEPLRRETLSAASCGRSGSGHCGLATRWSVGCLRSASTTVCRAR